MTVITGWLAAIGAFFLVLFLGSGFLGNGAGLIGACVAAYFAWKHFDDKYKAGLKSLLNPPSELWPLSMPTAWSCVKDVLSTAHMETGVSGISNWRIVNEDNTKGVIQAQLSFQQALGSPTQPNIVARSIMLFALLYPEGDGTRVEIRYEILSPMGTGMVEQMIKTTQASLKHRVAIGKGE